MRTVILAVLLLAAPVLARGGGHSSHVSVRGHTTKAGSYVAPHHRSAPDHSKANNWSTRGNANPDTGKAGTRAP